MYASRNGKNKQNTKKDLIDILPIMYYKRGMVGGGLCGYLTDTGLAAQDKFKTWLDYFRVPYGG